MLQNILPACLAPARGLIRALPAALVLVAAYAFFAAAAPSPAPENASPAAQSSPRTSPPPAQTTPQTTAADAADAGAALLWSTRAGDMAALVDEAAALQRSAEEQAKDVPDKLREQRAALTRLNGLFQASRGHPTDQLLMAVQMRALRRDVTALTAPLERIASVVSRRRDELNALRKDLDSFSGQRAAMSPAETDQLQRYSTALNEARRALNSAYTLINRILAPARSVRDQVDQASDDIEAGMADIWHDYYLNPAHEDGSFSPADIYALLGRRLARAGPWSAAEWLNVAGPFAAVVLAAFLAAFLGLRAASALSAEHFTLCRGLILHAWPCIALGLALAVTAGNPSGTFYPAMALLGALALIAGTVSTGTRLRRALEPGAASAAPLRLLYPPAAVGALLLFLDLPPRLFGPVWDICAALFLLQLVLLRRKRKEKPPVQERLLLGGAFACGAAGIAFSLGGYVRPAVLVFICFFALANVITLGSSLSRLLDGLAGRIFDKEQAPLTCAATEALAVPLAWTAALFCTLPWLPAVPGASYISLHFLFADYTVGGVSLALSRILIIALLYFLFRSFIRLGKATLDHLPDRAPDIERGVIPPLRNMLGYGLWALFVVLALSILGVDFTSLAVVAGGFSVGVGFGMQNIFNNLISGLMLIFGRTILVGDYVEAGGTAGTVRAVGIRSTVLETPERALVYVPNSAIVSGQFTNWTRHNRMVRRSVTVGVAYGSDSATVAALLLKEADKHPHVLTFPEPAVLFSDFGDSALEFTLNVFIDDLSNAYATLSELRFGIERSFAAHGIDIPFPQLSVHLPDAASPR
ncbi:MAG: mechanosensitive ion channel [Desulfovibrio sp.]|jgi:small-conductance mechanosensitive channel|nr:mechanosensitive ion channel [Desulfovibrio sp.]